MYRVRSTLMLAAAAASLLVLLHGLAFGWAAGRHADLNLMLDLGRLDQPALWLPLRAFAHVMDPWAFLVIAAGILAVPLATHRPRSAVAAGLLLAGANLTTLLLKPIAADLRWSAPVGEQIPPASWPSGHATAAVSLALAAIIVAPPRYRRLAAAVCGTGALLVMLALIALHWHFPSDVVAGALVAGAWGAVVMAVGPERRFKNA